MLISTIARRYAEALYEAAKDVGLTKEIGDQLEQLLRVLKTDRELDLAFRSPALTAHRRRQLLEECFQGVIMFLIQCLDQTHLLPINQILLLRTILCKIIDLLIHLSRL